MSDIKISTLQFLIFLIFSVSCLNMKNIKNVKSKSSDFLTKIAELIEWSKKEGTSLNDVKFIRISKSNTIMTAARDFKVKQLI